MWILMIFFLLRGCEITLSDGYNNTLVEDVFAKLRFLVSKQKKLGSIKEITIQEKLEDSFISKHLALEITTTGTQFSIDVKTCFGTICFAEGISSGELTWKSLLAQQGILVNKVTVSNLPLCAVSYYRLEGTFKNDEMRFFNLHDYNGQKGAVWQFLRSHTQLMD